ncbi:hypothetical protein [Saccharothrix sp. HUAS TT1]|uniref:hypothetical protein n=1 Tax=unclassified Saccharothrix TaxID=2593673 RepID=UPI00345B87F1
MNPRIRLAAILTALLAALAVLATPASARPADTSAAPEARDGYTFPVYVTNTDTITLRNVYIQFKHRDHTCSDKKDLDAGERKYYFTCKTWSDVWYHDYWFGSFDALGRHYQTKTNFYCDLGKNDAGKPVEVTINRQKMTVTPGSTGACTVSVDPV